MENLHIPGTGLTPGTLYCIGRNYKEHALELGNKVPEQPLVFLKPRSALCYSGDVIMLPENSREVHHEVELVLAVGRKGKNIAEERALDYIAAAGIGLDLTARDLQQQAKEKGRPWSVAKGFDTFAPISRFVPLAAINDIQNLELELSINGENRQTGNTSDMIFSCAFLVSYLSDIFTLYPGDLIFTGTPEGVSALKAGDNIEAVLDKNLTHLSLTVHHQ